MVNEGSLRRTALKDAHGMKQPPVAFTLFRESSGLPIHECAPHLSDQFVFSSWPIFRPTSVSVKSTESESKLSWSKSSSPMCQLHAC